MVLRKDTENTVWTEKVKYNEHTGLREEKTQRVLNEG